MRIRSWGLLLVLCLLLSACAPGPGGEILPSETPESPAETSVLWGDRGILYAESLAQIRPDVVSRTVSSYDRTGQNRDGLRYQNLDHQKGLILLEQHQPGVITRIWIGGEVEKDQAALHIYLDGSEKPIISGTVKQLCSGNYQNLAILWWETARSPRAGTIFICRFRLPKA